MVDSTVHVDENVGGGSGAGSAAGGAGAQTAAQLLQALAQSQSDMKRAYDQVISSLTENISKVASISEDFAKKQDTNVDEAMAGSNSVLAANQVTISNQSNNNAMNSAHIAATRSQTHFDNLQAIISLQLAGASFNQNAAQGYLAFNGHLQCGNAANAK